jgi:hypothetical protein
MIGPAWTSAERIGKLDKAVEEHKTAHSAEDLMNVRLFPKT